MRQQKSQQGFGLLEIIISLSLGTLLLGVCAQVLISSAKLNRLAQQQVDMQYSAHIIRNILSSDVHRAGFYSHFLQNIEVKGTAAVVDFVAACKGGDEAYAHMLEPKIFGLNGNTQNFKCLEKHIPGSDVLALKLLQHVQNVDTQQQARHQLYLKANLDQAVLFKAKDYQNIRNQISSSASNKQSLFRVSSRIYYLRDTGRRCGAHKISGLYREYSNHNSYMISEEIVGGVEQLQFQYWIDDQRKHAHEVGQEEWQKVNAISVDLLLRAECEESLNFPVRTFNLADVSVSEETSARFQRAHFQFDIALRN